MNAFGDLSPSEFLLQRTGIAARLRNKSNQLSQLSADPTLQSLIEDSLPETVPASVGNIDFDYCIIEVRGLKLSPN